MGFILLAWIKDNIGKLAVLFLATGTGAAIANELTDNALLTFITDLIGLITLIFKPEDVLQTTPSNLIIVIGYMFIKIIWMVWFIFTHIHYLFFIIELFIIARCVPIKNPVKMIENYIKLHINLIMFFVRLTIEFMNLLIRIGTMIANLIPGT